MKIALQNIRLLHPGHPQHNSLIDMVVENGRIAPSGTKISDADHVVNEEELCLSAGWLDMRASIGEPGHEQREDFITGARAAARGGFTEVAVLPSDNPVTQSRSSIEYIKARSRELPVRLLPLAALTAGMLGNDLSELTELHLAGAIAFTDGLKPIGRADVLARALEYVQPLEALVMQRPEQKEMAAYGIMHEGLQSTRLGMKGIPALAEEMLVQRDLQLLAYTSGRIHFSLLSTAHSVALVREARREGLSVTCDVAAHQLAFTDEDILPFDANFKVNPPFRSEADRQALLEGLADGTIDAIVSDHQPFDPESKDLEFDLAEFGITGLETAFAVANTYGSHHLNIEKLVEKFTAGPRQVLRLPMPAIETGAEANLTIFAPDREWIFEPEQSESKARNSPFYGSRLRGKVYATILGPQFTPNRFW